MPFELVSFEELKSIIGGFERSNDIVDVDGLQEIHDSVLAAFHSYTYRLFEEISRTETIYLGGDETAFVPLKATPISTVTSATMDGETITEDSDFIVRNDVGIRLFSKFKEKTFVITYTGGLSATPDDLSRAGLIQIAFEFARKANIGASNVSSEGGSVSYPSMALLPEVKRILDSYIHPWLSPL